MATLADFTPRELKILQLIIAGLTNREIAAELYWRKLSRYIIHVFVLR